MDATAPEELSDRQSEGVPEVQPNAERVYFDQDFAKKQKKDGIRWDTMAEANKEQFSAVGKKISLDKLAFDLRMEEGQARPIDPDHVANLKQALLVRPPLRLLSCLVWDNGSMPCCLLGMEWDLGSNSVKQPGVIPL